jgi:predicted Zn finger-like uncharacterized protein
MILACTNCSKKFHLDSSLIPNNGRKLQCGSCNHLWFYVPEIDLSKDRNETQISFTKSNNDDVKDLKSKKHHQLNNELKQIKETKNYENVFKDEIYSNYLVTKSKQTTFNIIKFLSYFLVFLITFIALIIVLDTFKSPLSSIIPGLEKFLYNFFETLKDLYLFIKNLLS